MGKSKRSKLNKKLRKKADKMPEPKECETSQGYATSKIFDERIWPKHPSAAYVRKPSERRELELWNDYKKSKPEILVVPPGSGKKKK